MKRAFTLLELVVIIAIIVILAAILMPVFHRTNCDERGASCRSSQKQIALALVQYAQDYDERFPPVSNRKGGWAQLLQPYCKSWQLFNCPSTPLNTPPASDYFFNGRLSRFRSAKVAYPSLVVLLGEGDNARSPGINLRSFPLVALEDQKSPAWRHREGANYAFADGHVKWFKPDVFDKSARWNPRAGGF